MIYTAIVAIGQGIIMIGGYYMSFNLILLGRIVFGIGAESIYVGQSAIASEWFLHYETSLALALCTCLPQMASFVAGIVIPKVYNMEDDQDKFGRAFSVGFGITCFCFIMVLILALIDYKTEKHDKALLERFTQSKMYEGVSSQETDNPSL